MGESFELGEGQAQATASATSITDSSGRLWAAQVRFHGDTTAPREWITDLFIEARNGDVARFGAQLVCRHEPDDPGFDPSRPRIVRNIIEALSAEADGVPLHNDFTEVNEEDTEDFTSLLTRTERRLPIVLVSVDDDGGAQVDLARLARHISGAAHLHTIKADASFELTRLVGKRMSTYNGAIRVYLPHVELENEDFLRHPLWLAPSSGWNPRATRQVSSRVLPLGFRDTEAGTRFWSLGLLRQTASRARADAISQGSAEKERAEIQALRLELENVKSDAATAESLMNEEALKRADADAEVARLLQENSDLRQRIRNMRPADSEASRALSVQDIRELWDQVPSLETSLNVIQSMFPERVIVLESAYESARDSAIFKYRKKAFELLWTLMTSYYESLANGEGDNEARKYFGQSYAAKEADKLSKAGRARRTFEYSGERVEMMKHLKIGVADNKADTLRVHFAWQASIGKILIGHCGAHLDF